MPESEENELYDKISSKFEEMDQVDENVSDDEDVPSEEDSDDVLQEGADEADGSDEISGDEEPDSDDADTAEEGDEKETKPAEEKQPEAESIDTATLLEAGRLGITAEQIEAFGTKNALRAAIQMKRSQEEEKAEKQERQEQPKAPEINFDELDIDDDLKGAFQGMVDYVTQSMEAMAGQFKPIEEGLSSIQEARVSQENVELEKTFDSALDEDKTIADTFGSSSPNPGTKEFEARKKLFETFFDLYSADRERGKGTPESKLIQAAITMEFPDVAAKRQQKKVKKRLEKRNSMKNNKPAEGKDETIPGEKRAYSKVAEAFKARKLQPIYD